MCSGMEPNTVGQNSHIKRLLGKCPINLPTEQSAWAFSQVCLEDICYSTQSNMDMQNSEKLFNILINQRNANPNISEIPFYTCKMGQDQTKTLMTTYAGKVVGQREHFCIAGRNARGQSPFGCQCGDFSENQEPTFLKTQ